MFRSEIERQYCIKHNDSPINHICPYCGNIQSFSEKSKSYRKTCGSEKCLRESFHSNSWKEKVKATKAKKTKSQQEEEYKKRKETWMKKYGVENVSKLERVKEQKIKTYTAHYGVTNPQKVKEINDRSRKTCLKKYGSSNPFDGKAGKEVRIKKALNTKIEKYGNLLPQQYRYIYDGLNFDSSWELAL